MEFLQPLLLWGATAISIPILIHLWHNRKGTKISWAAMRWLTEKENQPQKGYKPDNLLLLLLRLMIVLLIVLFLGQLYLSRLERDTPKANIHLVEPNATLVEEFRFELEQALSRGEELYWLNKELRPITSLAELEQVNNTGPNALENGLRQLVEDHHQLHLYLRPISTYTEASFFLTPVLPEIHLSEFSESDRVQNYLEAGGSTYLYVNDQGLLERNSSPPTGKNPISHTGAISYAIDLENEQEVDNITVALNAIEEVYGLEFKEAEDGSKPLLVFSYQIPDKIPRDQLVIVGGGIGQTHQSNVHLVQDPFTKEESEIVSSGRLPEYILEKVLNHIELTNNIRKVSRQQLERQFILDTDSETSRTGNVNEVILLLLLLTVIGERVIALRKEL